MSNYVNDLNDLITAKSEIKNIIQDTLNENPSEVFSYYPSYLRTIAAGYGGSSMSEDEINAYIAAYLSSYNFIDQDTLSANSYLTSVPSEFITQDELSAMGYLTSVPEVDLSSYVTYSYADNKYFGRLTGISGLSDGNVISSIGESFDAGTSVRGLFYQKTYVPSYAYIESYYTTKSELSNAGYLFAPTVSGYTGTMRLYNDGFFEVTTTGNLRVKTFSYNALNNWNAYTLINRNSLRNYVDGRLAEIEASYATTSQIPVIDENLIPKETNTYTLGDESHLYSAAYTSRVKVGNNSQIYNDSGGITFSVNSNNGIRIGSANMYPKTSDAFSLGQSSTKWASTYTTNLYTENVSYTSGKSKILMNDRNVDIYANNKKMINLSDYNGLVPIQTNVSLGGSSNKWGSTYISNLYADNAYISGATYLPTATYWWNGTSYVWLGSILS